MSNINTVYAFFDVVDYAGETKLSSYNLNITPLTFKARIPSSDDDPALNNLKVTYDYGDGNFGHSLTSRHIYQYPGKYNVRMVLRDCNNNAILGSYSTDVTIHDYLTNTFTLTGNLGLSAQVITLSAGEFSNALTVYSQSPFYQTFQDIIFSISACDSENYFNLTKDKNNALKKYNSFYEKQYLNTLSSFEHVEIDKISLSSTNIFAKVSSNGLSSILVNCLSTELSSIYVGSTGEKIIYFKTDDQLNPFKYIDLSFFKDRKKIFSKGMFGYRDNDFLNNFNIMLSTFVVSTSAQVLSSVKFSSNGITGEGSEELDTFSISEVQYKGLGIPFVLSPKNSNNFTMKGVSARELQTTFELFSGAPGNYPYVAPGISGVSIATGLSSQYHTISSLNNTLSNITDSDYWYRGLLTFDDSLSASTSFLSLSVRNNYYAPKGIDAGGQKYSGTSFISAASGAVSFTAYPKDYYNFYKHNENFDFEQTLKDLRFQEILLDKDILFTEFMGTIFGDVSSKYDTLGKTIWEKIQNFVSNNNDVDTCDLNSLLNLNDLVKEDGLVFDRALVQQPADLSRLMSLFSVSHNRFTGIKNKFESNFNDKGRTVKDIYGRNLGSKLDSLSYQVTAGTDIIAYEKFSDSYIRLNTFQPLCALSGQSLVPHPVSANTYMLSSIRTESHSVSSGSYWGWPLVLPTTYSISDIDKFYEFFSLSAVYEDSIQGSLIDYKNGLTTVPFSTPLSSLEGENNIFDIMIRNSLFSSLSLF